MTWNFKRMCPGALLCPFVAKSSFKNCNALLVNQLYLEQSTFDALPRFTIKTKTHALQHCNASIFVETLRRVLNVYQNFLRLHFNCCAAHLSITRSATISNHPTIVSIGFTEWQ